MEERSLRLLRLAAPGASTGGSRWRALSLAALLLATGATATRLGADPARRATDVQALARGTLDLALRNGSEDPVVKDALVGTRRAIGQRPLDSRTRVVYAGLVLALASDVETLRIAAFHARRAAELAPVTLSVTRAAARVLAHAGERQAALELVRAMFRYEPDDAAEALAEIEPRSEAAEPWIADFPEAWMAWYGQLVRSGETERARDWIRQTHARWPDHLPALEPLVLTAMAERDWDALAALLRTSALDQPAPGAATLLLAQARLAVAQGDSRSVRKDVERALQLGASDVGLRLLAGDVYEAAEAPDLARTQWTRALHELPEGESPLRRVLLLRLARLEDRAGQPSSALRLWRRVLEIEPENQEARRRVDDLSGFQR